MVRDSEAEGISGGGKFLERRDRRQSLDGEVAGKAAAAAGVPRG